MLVACGEVEGAHRRESGRSAPRSHRRSHEVSASYGRRNFMRMRRCGGPRGRGGRGRPGSFGRPRMRSPMMLCWISSVPPAIDTAGTETRTSAIDAVEQAGRAVEHRVARRRRGRATSADALAMHAGRQLAERALGPGGRPSTRAACGPPARPLGGRARCSRAGRCAWRTTGSRSRPVATAQSATRSARPARCGYQT